MKIYTRTGDAGQTGLFGGPRVRKDALRIEAYGTLDELNAAIGLARSEGLPADLDELLQRVQNELFCVGAELASPDPRQMGTDLIGPDHVAALESSIDRHEEQIEPLTGFILPAGTRSCALLHLARTVCRRAERRVVTLAAAENLSQNAVIYLNRLGDLLFVLARVANCRAGQGDVPWNRPPRQ